MLNTAPARGVKNTKRRIFKTFGHHISRGQIRFLSAGHLDVLESARRDIGFTETDTGKTYIDAFSSAGSFNTGRGNRRVAAALCEALARYDMGTPLLLSPAKIELARQLVAAAPGDLSKVLFTGSGADSIEAALKLAKGATGREEVISMVNAYHGHSGFSLSAGGKDYYKTLFEPLMPGFKLAPFGDLAAVTELASSDTAAVILEPIQGEGGIHVGRSHFLAGLRKLCDRLGIVLIFDEIQTGFGRTGRCFYCEYSGVVPDIMALAKSMGGGLYPNGAILYRDLPIFRRFLDEEPWFHASSGGGSNLGCRTSTAVIQELSRERLWDNAATMGRRLKAGLTEIMAENPASIQEVRGEGLMIGLEYRQEFMGVLMADCLAKAGIFAAYSGNAPQVMRFMLPLTVTAEAVDEFLTKFRRALKIQKFYLRLLSPLVQIPRFRRWLNEDNALVPINAFLRKFGL